MKKIITKSEEDTYKIAKKIGESVKANKIFTLSGDLGAGKTVFAKGLAAGLGVERNVTSPTFTIMKVYPIYNNPKIREFCHIDAYRLSTEKDLEAIGVLEYLEKKDVVTLIEWPEKIKKLLPKKAEAIKIKHKKEDIREIYLQ